MHDDAQDPLDTMLRDHLKRELEPHVGSALRRFDDEIRTAPRLVLHQRGWADRVRYAAAAVIMLGIGVAGSIVYRNLGAHATVPVVATDQGAIPFTEAVQSSWTQTYDAGTVLVDEQTPARMLRRVQYEKIEWKDETGKWQTRIDIPREDVILVDIPKH